MLSLKQKINICHCFHKFLDRKVLANSVDPEQTAPRSCLIRVCPVCNSVCLLSGDFISLGPHCSNCLMITANFRYLKT